MSKYRNRVTIRDGQRFDSRAEADRWTELCLLAAAGEIANLTRQPKFVLIEAFVAADGERESAVTYTADFMYVEGGQTIVEDVKGVQTRDYVIRRKLFRKRYGDRYHFREVRYAY